MGGCGLVELVEADPVALDLSAGFNFYLTLTANRTLAAPTNAKPGQCGQIEVTMDAVGGWTLSFDAAGFVFHNGSAPAAEATAGAVTVFSYVVQRSGKLLLSLAAKAVA